MLAEPGYDYLIDLQAWLLNRFFTLFSDIGFEAGAREAELAVTVYFMLDRRLTSVEAAGETARHLRRAELVIIRNAAIGDVLSLPEALARYREFPKDRELVLPRLSVNALNYLDRPDFTFAEFIAKNGKNAPVDLRAELWAFLEAVYNQRQAGDSGAPVVF